VEKIAISNFELPSMVETNVGQNHIIINPYISVENVIEIITSYVESYFGEDNPATNYIEAEYSKILGLIELQTNISIDNLDLDEILGSGLWNEVEKNLVNLSELNNMIYRITRMMEDKKSIGVSFDKLVNDISGFIEKISDVDLSSSGISELLKKLNYEKNEINKIIDPSKVVESVKKTRRSKNG
jgi:hypothetical protein